MVVGVGADIGIDGPATSPRTSSAVAEAIDLSLIRPDQRAQPRDRLDTELTAEYAERMRGGTQFPPLTVFFDGETYWLADGFHRLSAAQGAGLKNFSCEVRPGGLREAVLFSCSANESHGWRRSNEDKRRAVRRLLEDEEWRRWSDREIARLCSVAHTFVGKMRAAMQTEIHTGADTSIPDGSSDAERTFVHHKTGKPTKMDTTNIKTKSRAAHGPKIKVPDGETCETMVRRGMAAEAGGASADEAMKIAGMSAQPYRCARYIIRLFDRTDLSPPEAKLTSEALAALNETAQPRTAFAMVESLCDRIYGKPAERKGPNHEKNRLEAFRRQHGQLIQVCSYIPQFTVPYLAPPAAKTAVNEVDAAIKALKSYRTSLMEFCQ